LKSLTELLTGRTDITVYGNQEILILDIQQDSRLVKSGSLFVAQKGLLADGHSFIDQAIEKGAVAILCESEPSKKVDGICFVVTSSINGVLPDILNHYFDSPSQKCKLIGITGTNGKTTTATLCYHLFESLGYKSGLISTVTNRIHDKEIPSTHTTPDIISLYKLLNAMIEEQCSHVFMEVSSHAIDQGRIGGLYFTGGVFTNITHDHLDYHKTFSNYINTKKLFFDQLDKTAFALTNIDDIHGEVMLQNTKASKYTYAIRTLADYKFKIIENSFIGLHLKYNNHEWYSRLIGEFNAYNLLAVLSIALLLGEDEADILEKLSMQKSVAGRFEWIRNEQNGKVGIVDYAHTPDAVEKVLDNISVLRKGEQQIITVIGCGGNRDVTKRPEMARIAVEKSDKVILTSDNPRDEDPLLIIADMEAGIDESKKSKYLIIEDRDQAIKTACMISKQNDIILLAGKGHESYQEIKGKKYPFDDKEKLKTYLFKI